MDNNNKTTYNNVNSSRKCMKRRRSSTKSRKVIAQGLINMAEARREIVNALQLHRSSSSSISKSSPSKLVDINSLQHEQNSNNYYSPLIVLHDDDEFSTSSVSHPLPQEPKGSSNTKFTSDFNEAGDEEVEFEWPEIDHSFSSSSYSWWSSFLDSLDKNNMGCGRGVISCCKKVDNDFGTSYYEEGRGNEEAESNSSDEEPFADEWLIVPNADEEEDTI